MIQELETFKSVWLDTPYMAGQSKPMVGVDCVRLIVAWGKRLRDKWDFELPHHCQDAAFNEPRIVVECRSQLVEAFSATKCDPSEVKPGGILAIGRASDPFHVCIVLPNGKQILHAAKQQSKVVVSSIQAMNCDGFSVREAYNLA